MVRSSPAPNHHHPPPQPTKPPPTTNPISNKQTAILNAINTTIAGQFLATCPNLQTYPNNCPPPSTNLWAPGTLFQAILTDTNTVTPILALGKFNTQLYGLTLNPANITVITINKTDATVRLDIKQPRKKDIERLARSGSTAFLQGEHQPHATTRAQPFPSIFFTDYVKHNTTHHPSTLYVNVKNTELPPDATKQHRNATATWLRLACHKDTTNNNASILKLNYTLAPNPLPNDIHTQIIADLDTLDGQILSQVLLAANIMPPAPNHHTPTTDTTSPTTYHTTHEPIRHTARNHPTNHTPTPTQPAPRSQPPSPNNQCTTPTPTTEATQTIHPPTAPTQPIPTTATTAPHPTTQRSPSTTATTNIEQNNPRTPPRNTTETSTHRQQPHHHPSCNIPPAAGGYNTGTSPKTHTHHAPPHWICGNPTTARPSQHPCSHVQPPSNQQLLATATNNTTGPPQSDSQPFPLPQAPPTTSRPLPRTNSGPCQNNRNAEICTRNLHQESHKTRTQPTGIQPRRRNTSKKLNNY